MKTLATIFLLLFGLTASAQTSLEGKLTDAGSGGPIIFGTVALFKDGKLVTGTETDFDGYYSITNLEPGIYNVEFSYTGYLNNKIIGVAILEGQANKMDAKLKLGMVMGCGGSFQPPMVEADNPTQGFKFSSDDLRHLPHRW